MEFKDLKCDYNLYKVFFVVAKTGSFSSAAKALFISQPSVSYDIKTLEKLLGLKLFFRDKRTTTLTSEGKKLYKQIELIHNALLFAEKSVTESAELTAGEITIGAPTNIAKIILVPKIISFIKEYPNIKINIFSRSTNEMMEMLGTRKLDLVINTCTPTVLDGNFDDKPLVSLKTCFAGTPAMIKSCEGKALSDCKLILPNDHTTLRRILNLYFDSIEQQNLDSIIDSYATDVTLDLVFNNIGVGFFFEDSIKTYIETGKLKKLPLKEQLPEIKTYAIYNTKYITFTTKKFLDHLQK